MLGKEFFCYFDFILSFHKKCHNVVWEKKKQNYFEKETYYLCVVSSTLRLGKGHPPPLRVTPRDRNIKFMA